MAEHLTRLHRFIVEHYNLEEIRTLCFNLDVRYDDLGGEGISARARELVLRLVRQERLGKLLDTLREAHPGAFAEAGLDDLDPAALQAELPAEPAAATPYTPPPPPDAEDTGDEPPRAPS